MNDYFYDKIKSTINRFNMIDFASENPGDSVAVALSGGADSVCLLHILHNFQFSIFNFQLSAIHINHGIRGDEAERDEQFCVDLCKSLDIPIDVFHIDVPACAREMGMGLEEAGRVCRYEIFESFKNYGVTKIATAHTSSDNTETILLGLTRGCGLSGLAGIPPVRGRIIRPLIDITREEVESYCALHSLRFITDSTNKDTCFSRNKIRLEVIPRLLELNPNVHATAARLSEIVRDEDEFLEQLTIDNGKLKIENDESISVAQLKNFHIALRRRSVRKIIIEKTGLMPEFSHVEEACKMIGSGSGCVQLKGGWRAELSGDLFLIKKITPRDPRKMWSVNFNSELQTPNSEFVKVISIKEFRDMAKFNTFLLKDSLDYDTITRTLIGSSLIIRNRRDGDRFAPAGRGLTKSLRKLFKEAKIPVERRDDICVLTSEESEGVLWVEGFGPAEGYAVTDGTQTVLMIEAQNLSRI